MKRNRATQIAATTHQSCLEISKSSILCDHIEKAIDLLRTSQSNIPDKREPENAPDEDPDLKIRRTCSRMITVIYQTSCQTQIDELNSETGQIEAYSRAIIPKDGALRGEEGIKRVSDR